MIKWELFQGFNICKSTSVLYHNKKLKNKTFMIISIDSEKNY